MERIYSIVLNEKSFSKLLSRTFVPFESLEILIGAVWCGMFVVLGCVSCTIEGHIAVKRILRVTKDPNWHKSIPKDRTDVLRNCKLLGFFDRQVEITEEILEVIQRVKRLEDIDLSIAIVHNHPIIQDEDLSAEERSHLQMAYDLSGEKISYFDWLNSIQTRELTDEDVEVIKTFSSNGLGILVHGTRPECLREGGLIKDVMSAFQIRENSIQKIDMGILPLDFWKKLGIFHEIATLEKCVSKICEQTS